MSRKKYIFRYFDNQGPVSRFGHKCDPYQHWAAPRVGWTEQAEGWLTNCVNADREDAILGFFAVITKLHLCVGPVVFSSGHPERFKQPNHNTLFVDAVQLLIYQKILNRPKTLNIFNISALLNVFKMLWYYTVKRSFNLLSISVNSTLGQSAEGRTPPLWLGGHLSISYLRVFRRWD